MAEVEATGQVRETDLGKVVIIPKAAGLASYEFIDLIVVAGRAYLSTKDENTSPVTDTSAWMKITENTYDIAVRLGLFSGTEAEFVKAVTDAKQAASDANAAAAKVTAAGQAAEKQTQAAAELYEQTKEKADKLDAVIREGRQQIESMKAVEENITNYVQSAPTRMELSYLDVVTLGNPEEYRVKAKLFPAYVLQNVLYLPAEGADVLTVNPDGRIHLHKPGTAKVHVIPTHNIGLYKTIEITVAEPAIRLTSGGDIRLTSDGKIRLTQ